jgi:tRNA (guanine-N(7)-)-methyltransferase subunit TRM82
VYCTNEGVFCAGPRAGCAVSLSDDTGAGRSHSDAIRAICFTADGALFASAGDDKLVKVWKTDSWHCVRTM